MNKSIYMLNRVCLRELHPLCFNGLYAADLDVQICSNAHLQSNEELGRRHSQWLNENLLLQPADCPYKTEKNRIDVLVYVHGWPIFVVG